jgi:chromosome segregation ATPase
MAAFKFFNIGKANEEIENLQSQIATLTAENASLKENTPQVEAAAETLRNELEASKAKLAQAEVDLATAKASVASLTAEKETLSTKLTETTAKVGEQVKTAASAQAAAIVAGIGVPPVTAEVKSQNENKTFAQQVVAAAIEKANQRK